MKPEVGSALRGLRMPLTVSVYGPAVIAYAAFTWIMAAVLVPRTCDVLTEPELQAPEGSLTDGVDDRSMAHGSVICR